MLPPKGWCPPNSVPGVTTWTIRTWMTKKNIPKLTVSDVSVSWPHKYFWCVTLNYCVWWWTVCCYCTNYKLTKLVRWITSWTLNGKWKHNINDHCSWCQCTSINLWQYWQLSWLPMHSHSFCYVSGQVQSPPGYCRDVCCDVSCAKRHSFWCR